MRTFAIVKFSVPSEKIELLRAAIQYQSEGRVNTVRDYLENQVLHFAAAFGPECISETVEVGQE